MGKKRVRASPNRRKKDSFLLKKFIIGLFFIIGLSIVVLATAPNWGSSSTVNYSLNEEDFYFHNLSLNVSGYGGDVSFAINTIGTNITQTNGSGTFDLTELDVESWIKIYSSALGNLTINATQETQSGFFTVPIQATNSTDDEATTTVFEFIINATDDKPTFDSSETVYNWTSGIYGEYDINVSDEEFHYPINYTLTNVSCTHAEGTGRIENESCNIFNLTRVGNNSAVINITPVSDDVGVYWFNLSIQEFNSGCPHSYCNSGEYEVNRTTSKLVMFNVFSTFTINTTDCQNSVLSEDVEFSCEINITTREESETINITSLAFYQNSDAWTVYNDTFFYDGEYVSSTDFSKTVNITFTPTKENVGNYTINFSVNPDNPGDTVVEQFSIYVNYTEEPVSLGTISNVSLYENRTIYVSATDNDLLIQDFSVRDENLTFSSNESFVSISPQSLGSFDNFINLTIDIDYDSLSSSGDSNYSVLINVTDVNGSVDTEVFFVEILSDVAAEWNSSKSYINVSNEGDEVYINLSEYVNDTDLLTFSFTNDSQFDNFNLTTDGIINFTSTDIDVGYHNVTFNAYDGKLNSYQSFNFTIYNLGDTPAVSSFTGAGGISPGGAITEGEYISAPEDSVANLTLLIDDDDFFIPSGQRSQFYNETLSIDVNSTNSSGTEIDLFNFSFLSSGPSDNQVQYRASFTPSFSSVGNYTVVLNISDNSNLFVLRTFYLNITGTNDLPVLSSFSNQSETINDTFYLDLSATDQEDGLDSSGLLNFTLDNLTVGGNFLSINKTSGIMNFSLNETYEGVWEYNVSVNDTAGAIDFQTFVLSVYGYPKISSPSSGYIFNWTEGVVTGDNHLNVTYAVNSTNLTYKIYMDRIIYSDNVSYNYSELINDSYLRNNTNFSLNTNNNFTLNFTPNYTDETYFLYKNLTLIVFNPNYPNLNRSRNWKVNISHTNQNVTLRSGAYITDKGPATYGSAVEVNLSEVFEDADYEDPYYSQTVNFSLTTVSGSGFVKAASSFSDWILSLESPVATTEVLNITAFEYNSSNSLIGTSNSNSFQIEFIEPTATTTPVSSGGGGGTTKIKHFSLKLIVPEDVIISSGNFIEVPFKVQNNGQTDLKGIGLSSFVTFNDEFSDDVSISVGDDFIDELKIGESENFTLRINANTQRAGKYKATIYANVTSPKFSDFGDFFIELRKTNETEAEQILIFTQKFISENPECLELTELLIEAEGLFALGDYFGVVKATEEIVAACEDAITGNEQISFSAGAVVEDNLYYISFMVFTLFLAGFIFYIYKRVRFNKSKVGDYI